MAEQNNASRLSGQYMIQDRGRLSEVTPVATRIEKTGRGAKRQADQSQSSGHGEALAVAAFFF